MYDDEDLFQATPGAFDLGVTNSTATTPAMIQRGPGTPPIQLDLGPNPADALLKSLSANPAPLSASPGVPGSNASVPPMPQPQNVPRGTSQTISSPPPMPDSPAPTLAEILAGAQKANQTAFGDYSPEKRQELVKYMMDKQNSTANGVGQALAGLGDALVRGPGRRDSHFLDDTIKRGQDATERAIGNFDQNSKLKSQGLQTGLSLQQMDPSSPASKSAQTAARPMLMAAGLTEKQIGQLPASAIDDALKSATSFADAKAKLAQVAAMREQTQELTRTRKDEETGMKFEQELNASKQRSGALGDNQKRLNASERVLNLLDQVKLNPNAMQTPEVAQAVASLVGGGGGVVSQQQIEHLMPQSFKGDVNKFLGWLTNEPRGLGQQEFIKSFMHTAERERDLINRQIGLAQAKSTSGFMEYIQRHPDQVRAKLEAQNLPEPVIQNILKGNYTGLDKTFQTGGGGVPGAGGAEPPVQKQIGGKNYVKQNGQWIEL